MGEKKKKKSKDSILFGMIQDKDNSFHSSQSTRQKKKKYKTNYICLEQIQGDFTLPSPSDICPSSLHTKPKWTLLYILRQNNLKAC